MNSAFDVTEGPPPDDDPSDLAASDAVLDANVADDMPLDSFQQQVVDRVGELLSPKSSWFRNFVALGVTLALFVLLGLAESGLSFLIVLVGVLLLHESGHYVGMRVFGYRNVRMFFIPLFGAAVSGISTRVSPLKKGVILLLGPLPGIMLGAVLAVVYRARPGEWIYQIAVVLVILNAFNLLPLLPLDGGRLFHLVLFSRNRYIEAVFTLLASLGLMAIGWLLSAWLLLGLGVLMLFGVSRGLLVGRLAKTLQSSSLAESEASDDEIPPAFAAAITDRIVAEKPMLKQINGGPRSVAQIVLSVWDKLTSQPPGILTSLLLLGTFAFSIFVAMVAVVLLHMPASVVVDSTATQAPREETYYVGMVYAWAEVGEDSLYHGRHEIYTTEEPRSLLVEGNWKDGYQQGKWKYYDQGEVFQVVEFQRGKAVSVSAPREGGWVSLPRDMLEEVYLANVPEEFAHPRGPASNGWQPRFFAPLRR
jgi:Zn-dependent protease